MTAEQAKALAVQYESQAPKILEEEEPEYTEEAEDEIAITVVTRIEILR